ncbi:MAG: DMT family transporter [Alphaproteobacteria bacterium]|nr:DMT family transporter [Alphaproteobacteria bacterium]
MPYRRRGVAARRPVLAWQLARSSGYPYRRRDCERASTLFHALDQVVFVLLGIMAGLSFVIQQAVNADLRGGLGSAAWAGFVSYFGGTLCMLLLAALLRDPVPEIGAISRANWWAWSGGVFGAIYIAISIFLVPRLGAAFFIALLITGQMVASMIFDHFGLLGLSERPIDVPRIIGVVLLVLGVFLIRF